MKGLAFAAPICAVFMYDRKTLKRLADEMEYLKCIQSDAATQLETASDDRFFSVRHSEKEVYQKIINETKWCISEREGYVASNLPIIRAFLAPADARDTMSYAFMMIAIQDDGDFYDSYMNFITRHSEPGVGFSVSATTDTLQ